MLRLYADTDSPVAKTAAHLGINRKTVQRAIDELCAAGLVVRPTGFTFPEMSHCDIPEAKQPVPHPLPPAAMVLSTSTFVCKLSTEKAQQTSRACTELAERLVKYRHTHRRRYRKHPFVYWPQTKVTWERSAWWLLDYDGVPLTEALAVLDFAFTTESWPPKIRTVYDLRRNYHRLLQQYRQAQVDDIPHEPRRDRP